MNTPTTEPTVRPGPAAERIVVATGVDEEQAVAYCLKCLQPIYPDEAYRRLSAVRRFIALSGEPHPGYDAFIHDDCGAPSRAVR